MAIDIFSIPPMSAEAERVFSGARRTISWERATLGAITVEITECLKHWITSGLSHGASYTAIDTDQAVRAAEEALQAAARSRSTTPVAK